MVACIAAPADLREAAAMTKTPRRRRPSDRRVGGGGGCPMRAPAGQHHPGRDPAYRRPGCTGPAKQHQ